MHPFAAFCRRNLNALGLELYSLAYPLLPKDRRDWLFEKNVNIVPAETGVKIIDRDGESVTIGTSSTRTAHIRTSRFAFSPRPTSTSATLPLCAVKQCRCLRITSLRQSPIL